MRRSRAAIILAVGLTLFGLTACSGDSDPSANQTTGSPTSATTTRPGAGLQTEGDVAVPETWPDVVPLPAEGTLTSATSINENSSIMVIVDPPASAAVEAYAAQLLEAGFTPGASLDTEDGISQDFQGNGFLVSIIGVDAAGQAGLTISVVATG